MPRKFIYAPGLPGYGIRGADGSTGLLGLAMYFSSYDGNADTVTIKSKIIANKELFANDQLIAGYPDRVYQTGDLFIDKNARVFEIDMSQANLYKDTGVFLNTSGFFTEGPTQAYSPQFTRYSNSFETEKFLIDTVYTNSVGDYTQYPTSLYGNSPRYFARVNYIGSDVVSDLNSYYPFEVWTIGNSDDDFALGLAREETSNTWHFGNDNSGDVSIYFDFNDFYCPSIGQYNSGNTILYWNPIDGRVTQGAAPAGMTMSNYGQHRMITAGNSSTNINAEEDLEYYSDSSTLLYTKNGVFNIDTSALSSGTASIFIRTGIPTGTSSLYQSGNVSLRPGDGNNRSTAGAAGNGGHIILHSGNGGSGQYGGIGGDVSINAGLGGSGVTYGTPGKVYISGGTGSTSVNGGDTYLMGGNGGSSSRGGYLYLWAGDNGTRYVLVGSDNSGNDKGGAFLRTGSASSPALGFGANKDVGFYYATNGSDEHIKVTMDGTTQFAYVNNNSTSQGDFYATGNVIAYGTIPSDVRLKKDIKLLTDSLEKVNKLKPISYVRKSTGELHLGLIAQEVEKVIPEVITETNILGEDETIKYKTINYDELIPHLVGAIKELKKEVEELKEIIKNKN